MTTQTATEKFGKFVIACFLIIFLVIFSFIIAAPGHTSQLSIYSEDWNDLSKFRNDLEALNYNISHTSSSPLYLREVEVPERSIFMIVGIEREYTEPEVNAISKFLNDGGSVILADDFGYGNSFLEKLRIGPDFGFFDSYYYSSRIGYEFLHDQVVDIEYDRDPNYPRVEVSLIEEYELIMNAPSGFIPAKDSGSYYDDYFEEVEVLAQTTSMSWVDKNGNYSRDVGELGGPFQMILRLRLADEIDISSPYNIVGPTIILISDPSIFINEMWELADNREFILSQVFYILPYGGDIIFDESVHISDNPVAEFTNAYYQLFVYIYGSPAYIFFIILALLLILSTLYSRRESKISFRRHKDTLDSKMLYMMNRPELDQADYYWMKMIMLDKVRISYEIPFEVFYSYTPNQYKVLIDDPEISSFLFDMTDNIFSTKFTKIDESIVKKIIAWKPKKIFFTKDPSDAEYIKSLEGLRGGN